ncbi:multicopper oxidase domain-containing protein [Flavobacterium sp.]|uniref:multicopper oxidase domain-containing protein n=1 Tax=Flavobacterium sp. TaxID=239 RepID=UPI0039192BAF
MKKLIQILLLLFMVSIAHAQTKKEMPQTIYTCVMDPQVRVTKPGNCPICGMKLIKAKPQPTKKKPVPKPITTPVKKIVPVVAREIIQDTVTTVKEVEVIEPKQPIVVLKNDPPKTIRYDLYVRDTIVNFTGKPKRAIAVNGQIPMPTLTFTQGDTAEIYVHNELKESTSLHWHGLFLPNKEDGVPNLTQMPIEPGTTHKYTFPIIQHGTHWYHSHSGLQEQIGMYGSFVMNKRNEDPTFRKGIDDLPTIPVILSEWTDMKPENVHRMLHNATDWFAIKKGTTQSYAEAIKNGHFLTKVTNEWKRMNAMDVSDVYYDKFLINGKTENQFSQFKAGDKVRLRISNGGASSYFWLNYSGGKITVVASDGNDVEPVEVDRLLIAVSETYDVIVTIPEDNIAYEFLVTPEDRTKSTSLFLGNGTKHLATPLPKLKYFEGMKMMNEMMKMNGDLDDMGMKMSMNTMDMNSVMYPEITGASMPTEETDMSHHNHGDAKPQKIVTLNYAMLKSPTKTNLPSDAPVKELRFELSGNMNRYVWSMDNKVVSETDKILIKKGEIVRITMYNGSMMRHPMHLHGHDFRAINGQGDYAPLKNIIDIMPMETDTIEFEANVEGDWFFHCHILYHMMAGMGRVFSYENQAPNPLIPNLKLAQRKLFADDRQFHIMAENDFATNGNDGMLMIGNTRWSIGTEWRLGYGGKHGYETETHIGRYLGKMQWWMPFIGFDWRYRKMHGEIERNLFNQKSTKDERSVFSAGIEYTMPMLVKAQAEVFTDGNFRLQFERMDIPLSKRLRMNLMWNTDKEYMAGFRYILTKNLGATTHYDSDMGLGFGVNLNY